MQGVFVYFGAAILLAYTHCVDGEFYKCVQQCPSIQHTHLQPFNFSEYNFYRNIVATTGYHPYKCMACNRTNGQLETVVFVFKPDQKYPGAVFDVLAPDGHQYKWVVIALESSPECGNLIAFLYCKCSSGNGNCKRPMVVVTQDHEKENGPRECYYKIFHKIEKALCLKYRTLMFYEIPNKNC